MNISTSQWLCFAGCGQGNYWTFEKLIKDPSLAKPALPKKETQPTRENNQRTISAIYQYQDIDGEILYEVIRYEPKSFSQRKFGGNNMDGVSLVPYHYYDLNLRKDEVLFWVEGEKDADKLMSLSFLASTSSGGANNWKDYIADKIPQKFVVIIPDQDFAGCQYAEKVIASLRKRGKTVLLWNPPDKDVSEFLDKNGADNLLSKIWDEGSFYFTLEDPFRFFERENIPIKKWSEMKSDRIRFIMDQLRTIHNHIKTTSDEHHNKILDLIDSQSKLTRDGDNYLILSKYFMDLILIGQFKDSLFGKVLSE